MTNLYLFDIDGTLVDLTETHLRAYRSTFNQIVGKVPSDELIKSTWGKTETDCHKIMLNDIGADISLLEKTLEEYEKRDRQEIASGNIRILPGVQNFLDFLTFNQQYRGIITGQSKITGEQILQNVSLIQYFQVFGYGDNKNTRADIVRSAVDDAHKKRLIFNKAVVIGDTPADVEAAKQAGVLSIAVATGHKSFDILKETGADLILENLIDYKKIIEIVQ